MKRIYRTKILSFLATAWRATLTTLLSALSGLRRLLAGLLVRVLLAAATLLTALAALILILLIHWKVPLGFCWGNIVQRRDADPCSCPTSFVYPAGT